MKKQKSDPKFVLISDVHYSLNTLDLADAAFRAAILKAHELNIPLVDAGDLTNDKAVLRAECVNAIIESLKFANRLRAPVFSVVGNHSLLNEKGKEHSLHFMRPYCTVIDKPITILGLNFIPYQKSEEDFLAALTQFPSDEIVVAHQGTIGGFLGDYVKDSSAFDPIKTAAWRLFLGHYHKHYELYNTVSIGNPYTLTFGEANDGDKGFLIVNEDGTFTREILKFRKHVIVSLSLDTLDRAEKYSPVDLVWVKLSGPTAWLNNVKKKDIGNLLGLQNFKLDKIISATEPLAEKPAELTESQVLDALIDSSDDNLGQKQYLKHLWREVLNAAT